MTTSRPRNPAPFCCAALIVFAWAGAARADARLCDTAALGAAQAAGVPADVLRAITRVETGRGPRSAPWPWTINIAGKGFWFPSRAAAEVFLYERFLAGARNFDVGCFQVNYQWHGANFASIDEMFDPAANAAYAALFLSRLHAEFGDWTAAAGAYHSRTPVHRDRYTAKFESLMARLAEEPSPAPARLGLFAPRRAIPLRSPGAPRGADLPAASLVPRAGPVPGPGAVRRPGG